MALQSRLVMLVQDEGFVRRFVVRIALFWTLSHAKADTVWMSQLCSAALVISEALS